MRRNILMQAVFAAMYGLGMAETGVAAESDKKAKFAEKEYDLDTKVVSITFGNGQVVEVDLNQCSPEMQTQLMLHGASQKIGDSYAGAKGNYAEAISSAKDVIAQLLAGEWRAGRDDSARPRLAELAAAIARIKSVDLEKATAAVEKANDEQRKAWRSNAKVKAVIAQIRAEKAAKALEEAGEQTLDVDVS